MKRILQFCLAVVFTFSSCPLFTACKSGQAVRTKYEVTAEYAPEHQTLTGVVKTTFQNATENELSALKFQIYTNAYRENALYPPVDGAHEKLAYYDGKSYGETKVTSVNGAKSWQVTGEDENILSVTLTSPLYPGESVVLDVGFTVTLSKINHRFGIAKTAVHLGRFFPVLCGLKNGAFEEVTPTAIGSPFVLDCADYKISFTMPNGYNFVSSCQTESVQTLETKTEYVFVGEGVRNFGLALYSQRNVLEERMGGCTVRYVYEKDDAPEGTLKGICEAFGYFQKTFGAYPYPTYTVIETELATDVDGYTALVFCSSALKKEERARALYKETAKQWFGEIVGVDRVNNAWQYEGLAQYLALTAEESLHGARKEKAVAEYLKEYRLYYDVYGNVLDRTDTKMKKPLSSYVNGYEYRCLSINKAVVMLDALQKSIGEKRLIAGLKRYFTEYSFCQTGEAELVGAIERHGVDVQGFFDGFLEGKVIL